jgi:16S rRNA (cytidine1402-2'-O)-methyltransferase
MSVLYLVATPIGNLEDVTLRALRVLREVSLIAAEDTRTARKLLARYDIHTPLLSYTDRNKRQRTPQILAALARGDVALVSEAGTPAISDPGADLVAAAYQAGFTVSPVPGPSVLTAAVASSGLSTRRFYYLGFLPRQPGQRRRLLRAVAGLPDTLVAFESPHRLREALDDIAAELGDRRIVVCRELTKLHEEIFRGSLREALAHFTEPRGEFTLVIEGAPAAAPTPSEARWKELDAELRALKDRGAHAQEAVAEVARRHGLSRRDIYRRWLTLR